MRTWVIGITVCFCGFIIWISTQSSNNPQWTTKAAILSMMHDSLRSVAFCGEYDSLSNKPTLFGGAYGSLSGLPTLNITNWNSAYANMGKVFIRNKSGIISSTGIIVSDTFTITDGNTIDLSAYLSGNGYTAMTPIAVCGFRVGATATNAPQLAITGWTNTTVTVIATQSNSGILGILAGLITVTDFVNSKCHLTFIAY